MASLKQYVTKSGKKMWRVTVFAGVDPQTGKKKYIVRGGFNGPDGKKKAALTGARLELAVSKGNLPGTKKRPVLFEEVYKEWRETYVTTVRESTYAQTVGLFQRHILPALGDKRIATITNRDLQRSVNRWHESAPNNYRMWFGYVRRIFVYAMQQGYVDKGDPTAFVTIPRREETAGGKRIKFWTPAQIRQFFNCIDKQTDIQKYTIFRVYAYTAMRRSELLALEWPDVDFQNNTISINKTLAQGMKGRIMIDPPKTRSSNRTITVDAGTMDCLREWRQLQSDFMLPHGYKDPFHPFVFPGRGGGHMSINLTATWMRQIIEENGLQPLVLHGFRHSAITNMMNDHVPLTAVTQVVGHANPSTTLKVYTHADPQQAKQATTQLANVLDAPKR